MSASLTQTEATLKNLGAASGMTRVAQGTPAQGGVHLGTPGAWRDAHLGAH